jgi:acetolactate decarboxylase
LLVIQLYEVEIEQIFGGENMKKAYCLLAVIFLIIAMGISGCLSQQKDRDILFQVSTIEALSKGVYDGDVNFRDLKQHGDFGIGTFDGLDGEMVALAGEFYQIKADGKAYAVEDTMMTPFAIVTFFESDKAVSLDKTFSLEQLEQYLDNLLPTKNIFYAIKVDGVFDYIKTRSVPKQDKPYPSLAEALKEQSILESRDVTGTMVGFWCPDYVEGLNVPGYHFHFITRDRKAGGHLLDCQTQNVKIEIDHTSRFFMTLPGSEEFYKLDLEAK